MPLFLTLAIAFAMPDTPPSPQAEPSDKAKLICKSTGVTGSRVRAAKVCKTRNEWDIIEQASRKRVEDYRGNGRSTMRQGSGS